MKEAEDSKNGKRKYHDDSSRNSGQIMNKSCKKCGSISHYSKDCMCYPFFMISHAGTVRLKVTLYTIRLTFADSVRAGIKYHLPDQALFLFKELKA